MVDECKWCYTLDTFINALSEGVLTHDSEELCFECKVNAEETLAIMGKPVKGGILNLGGDS